MSDNFNFLYKSKQSILTNIEKEYLQTIKKVLPEGFYVITQQSLSTLVEKTDNSKYRNELFRIIDFVVVNKSWKPLICIEINDASHEDKKRRERDEKVRNILEEAGIPLIVFWTKYGIKEDYISKRLNETINSLPVKKICHFNTEEKANNYKANTNQSKKGCYIATCVYNSYDCPEVWTLRRFRDEYLDKHYLGKVFIKIYYKVSPIIVNKLGDLHLFKKCCKNILDKFVFYLNKKGYENNKYED